MFEYCLQVYKCHMLVIRGSSIRGVLKRVGSRVKGRCRGSKERRGWVLGTR